VIKFKKYILVLIVLKSIKEIKESFMNRMLYGVLVASSLLYSSEEPKNRSSNKIVLTLPPKQNNKNNVKAISSKIVVTRKSLQLTLAAEQQLHDAAVVNRSSAVKAQCKSQHSPEFEKEENIKK